MKSRTMVCFVAVLALWMGGKSLWAQQAPDTILCNGKIVTVDNHEVSANLGTIAQAIAVREGKIVAVGNTADIRRLAGSSTKSYDLKGRTVLPGIALTHDHPQDWDPLNPYIMKKVVTDDIMVHRFLDATPQEQLAQFPKVLDEAVHKAKPGQWVRIVMLFGRDYRWRDEISGFLGRQLTKQMLDMTAPNNPVIVRTNFVGSLLNQKAIDETKKWYGDQWDKFLPSRKPLNEQVDRNGTCSTCYREVEQDAAFPPNVLEEIYRQGLSWMAGYGQTLNATALYTGGAIRAYTNMDRKGQMAIRMGWAWFWPERNDFFADPYFTQAVVAREGTGSDYFWVNGMVPHMGGGCSKLPGTSPEVKQKEAKCGYTGQDISRALYEYVKAGGRLSGDHIMADGEIDLILDIIEKAGKDAGMTLEEIRSKRHVTEHMAMYPRPDQIPRFKNLGVMTSGWDFTLWEARGTDILKDYGERGAMQIVPRKSLYDAGIINSMEMDRALASTDLTLFHVFYSGITRKDWDGKVIAPQEGIGREAMLKSATLFGAYGSMKEKVLGSLEAGKLADLIVLDRDYLTIPVDDILKIRVLMTMVGGKVAALTPSLAREWGLQPAGAQVELGGPAAQW
ncbi:MAG: amidohydrolase family protein [Acidobacteria bacterium]|nr:amidohydrolase family protein [Acidobacteriota bacterium]